MKLHLASGNTHKVQEFQALADATLAAWSTQAKTTPTTTPPRPLPSRLEIISARAVGGMPAVAEDTGTFLGNARVKALALRARLPADAWVLADDSGLCVDALGGGPGVESAYYAGPAGDGAANLHKLLTVLAAVPPAQRGAHFFCGLLLLGPGEQEAWFEGRCTGTLSLTPSGGAGFGYDPIFVHTGETRTFAELTAAEKHTRSHRGQAWAHLTHWLASRAG